ncbi:MAG: VCBS repeat-containing protein [Sandaracinus sp.]|nr:VCBS repeat-containing protein [Sandaracinus sp.]
MHGRTGETLWTVSGANAGGSQGTVALANLDPSDASMEVVYVDRNRAFVVLDGETTAELARFANATSATYGNPSIHDMDGDGVAEIVLGGRVFDFTESGGTFTLVTRWNASACSVASASHSVVANLDADPQLEIACGATAFDHDGTVMWGDTATSSIGYAAVGDLNADGAPEVVMVRSTQVSVRDGSTGTLLMGMGGSWFNGTMPIPAGGEGGPPTIADFDGDGLPEIATAGSGAYAVYDPDCAPDPIAGREAGDCTRETTTSVIRWSASVQDLSSSRTGSSVFDFQGDGIAEVVYNDECFLHVFDGRDGREILMEPFANSSRTGSEYPIVVDVDRDGNSEIVVPANNDQISRDDCRPAWRAAFGYASDAEIPERFRNGTQGLYALGDPGDRWVRTRPVWNQYAYAVTHVGDRGEVPATPPDNWSVPGLNNFRQNVQGAGVFNAPNLTVDLETVAACGASQIRLSAVVRNIGSRGVPAGVPVELVQTAPAPGGVIATLTTTRPLLPGGSERLTAVAMDQPTDVELRFEARVDGDTASSTVIECNEDDNAASGSETCPGLL